MPLAYRYSEWDGTQSIPGLDADKVIEALSDDIMNFGDLQHALRNLMQRGMRNQQGDRMQGLRDLLQKLRQQRRERLDQLDLGGVMEDIKRQLEEILQMERDTLQDRLDGEQPRGAQEDAQPQPSGDQQDSGPRGEQQQGQRGQQSPQEQRGERGQQQASEGMDGGDDATDDGQPGQGDRPSSMGQRGQQGQRGQRQQGSQPGQDAQPGDADGAESSSGQPSGGGDPEQQFREMLQRIAERKQHFLEGLPGDAPGQMKALQDYEFLNPEAQHKFQELVDQLRQAMTGQFFKDVQKMVEEMSDGDKQRMKDMVRALNDMLAQKMRGQEPDFDSFMEQFGDMFGDNPPQSLEELMSEMQAQMQAMQSLMASMPGDQRQQLQDMLAQHLGDPELEDEISQLAQNLEFLNPNRGDPSSYPFRGDEEVGLEQAMRLMNEMHNMDDLENDLERAQYNGDLDTVDIDQLRELLGDDSAEQFEELKKLLEVLEQAGYVRREGDEWKLTPRGTRMIGQTALGEIYKQLKKQGLGNHPAPESGRHGERLDESKPYEFGDPFHLDMRKTLMNAIERGGRGTPVKLSPDDFEINRSELVTTTTTVLMVDLSWSMALRGSFQAAKKVALALQNLIKAQYPKDSLYIIGFSAYARELKPHELPYVRWDESVLGTNMHHALMLAERLLARHRVGTKQILMISDGEPTAHLENGRSQFAYPPSPITIRETLKAVKRVTQQEITINTFMLDRNYYLKEFVNQLATINGGRVFYTTPEKLGEYLLVDYVAHKRKHLTGR